jgi:diaminopimelate decarboxylase
MTGGSRPFGVDTEQAPALLSHLRELPSLRFAGFHCFAGAQVLEAEVLAAQLDQTFETLGALLPICPEPPRVLNLGGGFGIPYTAQDTPLDLRAAGAAVAARVAQHRVSFPEARFVIELGRALVGGAGLYLTRVLDRKVSRGTTFLVLDGGLHHCLAATGNFGQVIHRPYPVCAPAHIGVPTEAWETVALAGPLCTPLDTFGAKVALPPLHEGDLVAVMCTGAYGRTASPEAFLSHPAPAEAMVP